MQQSHSGVVLFIVSVTELQTPPIYPQCLSGTVGLFLSLSEEQGGVVQRRAASTAAPGARITLLTDALLS